ncbi:MAG: cytochrome c-type biogenesis protein [Rhodanobacteraceae bacterium]
MRRFLAVLVAVAVAFASVSPAYAVDPLPFKNDAQRQRFQHLTSQLRCMVCQNESLDASNADLAKDLRHQIFDMMQQGKSDDEIKRYLVARYSDFVLYDPPLQASTVLLWFGPPVLLVIGGIVVVVLLRRRVAPAAAIAPVESGDDW